MDESYKVNSTSKNSAAVDDRVISEKQGTRRVMRPIIVDNPKDPAAGVKVTIIHQRKRKNEDWEDIECPPLYKLRAGDHAKLALDSKETLALFRELENLYAIKRAEGVPRGEQRMVAGPENQMIRVDKERAHLIQVLLDSGHSREIWNELVGRNPDLATRLSHARIHENRIESLKEFSDSIEKGCDEPYWQKFFEKNAWIFGYGLDYRFMRTEQPQPIYSGASVDGTGAQRGDFLGATSGEARFTVVVEIKTPAARLLGSKYRNGAYPASTELAGGIAQVHSNCRQWDLNAGTPTNSGLRNRGVYTVQPKGILVIGQTAELDDDIKRDSFEMLRRNLSSPEILTFDELCARAEHIVRQDETLNAMNGNSLDDIELNLEL